MTHKIENVDRRSFIRAGAALGGGLCFSLLAGSTAVAKDGAQGTVKEETASTKEDEAAFDGSAEKNLRADDPTLTPRARGLIRIGETAIAREDPQALAAFFHPEFRFHGPDGMVLTKEVLWEYFAACRAAFDDFAVTRQQIFSDGGAYVAARTTFSGVFARPFTASPVGTLQPHGKRFFYKIHNVFRYAPDGKLIEEWAQSDSRLFLERLGVRLVPAK